VVRGGERPGPDTGRTGAMLALLACFEGNRTAVSTGNASSRDGSLGKLRDMSPGGLHTVVSKVVEQRGLALAACDSSLVTASLVSMAIDDTVP